MEIGDDVNYRTGGTELREAEQKEERWTEVVMMDRRRNDEMKNDGQKQ